MTISNLNTHREQIDSIDEEIIKLFVKRFTVTSAIGHIKKELNIESFSPEREREQFRKLKSLSKNNDLPFKLVEQIFRLIINEVVRNHESIKNNND